MQGSHKKSDFDDGKKLPEGSADELKINRRTRSVYEEYLKQTIQSAAQEEDDTHPSYRTNPNTDRLLPVQTFEVSEDRSNSGVKWLTAVGVFCAILLIGVIVVILNVTGVLVSLSKSLPTISAQTPVATEASVGNTGLAAAKVDNKSDSNIGKDTNTVDSGEISNAHDDGLTANITAVTDQEAQPITVKTRKRSLELQDTNVVPEEGNTEPAISFDDFTKEAGVILYRETSD